MLARGFAPTDEDLQVERCYIDLGSKPLADEQPPSWGLLFPAEAMAEPKLLLGQNTGNSRLSQDHKHAFPFQREMIPFSLLLLLWVLKGLSLNGPTGNFATLSTNI